MGKAVNQRLLALLSLIILITMFVIQFSRMNEKIKEISMATASKYTSLEETEEAVPKKNNSPNYLEIKWEPSGATWQLWKDKGLPCSQYKTRFATGLPRTYLMTFPGSGNTWTRYLIEAATGIFTGSVYNDQELRRAGYLGESGDPKNGRTIVQKTHSKAFSHLTSRTEKMRLKAISPHIPAILVIRNPVRAIMSYWRFKQGRRFPLRHKSKLGVEAFQTAGFHSFAMQALVKWEQLITDRISWSEAPVHVVFYEDLVRDSVFYVRDILQFLRVPPDEGRLTCLSADLEGYFKREVMTFDPFMEGEKVTIRKAVMRVSDLLQDAGYRRLPSYQELE